ncbi:beta-galactosidase domain 3-containing protein [Streptomyces thermoviolaceus]|uniref:beta-galactosidase domain 3-containing protein n=1 Tax=Streptomyces thermoviolaceus TaxID=1952 RepID=UPI0027E235ED|nr:beta-galactosidase domain 3-containing protein [Streptomyces thermoviolaceus]
MPRDVLPARRNGRGRGRAGALVGEGDRRSGARRAVGRDAGQDRGSGGRSGRRAVPGDRPRGTDAGAVLVSGPALVRDARITGTTVHLTGDTTAASALTVWSPSRIRTVRWNGRRVPVSATALGGLTARSRLAGPPAVSLPEPTGWRHAPESPETDPDFDDRDWRVRDLTTSHSAIEVPAGQPAMLFADDYGVRYGDVWYRATVTAAGDADTLSLTYQADTLG